MPTAFAWWPSGPGWSASSCRRTGSPRAVPPISPPYASAAAPHASDRAIRPGRHPGALGATGCRRSRCRRLASSEPPLHVVRGSWVVRIAEDLLGRSRLDDPPRVGFAAYEEQRTVVGNALCLLHVVSDDHDGELVRQLSNRLLDHPRRDGI